MHSHNWEINTDTISRTYSDFTRFKCPMCVGGCFILYNFLTRVDSGDHAEYLFKQFLIIAFYLGFTFERILSVSPRFRFSFMAASWLQ